MVTRDIEIERRLKELKDIVKRFNHIVTSYIDCVEAIDGTISVARYSDSDCEPEMDEETEKFYIDKANEITLNMPLPAELENFLAKYQRREQPVSEDTTTKEETVAKYMNELRELVHSVANDLCTIDNIDECLCPNNDKDIDTYLTPEQWNERQQIMNSLEWHICMEFPQLIKEEELKRHNIK